MFELEGDILEIPNGQFNIACELWREDLLSVIHFKCV